MNWNELAFPMIIFGCFVLPVVFGGVATLLKHREKVLKMKYERAETKTDEKLLARIDALEKKCEMLQEQVTEAHALLVDERRMLDQKLAQRLAEGSALIPDSVSRQNTSAPVRTMN